MNYTGKKNFKISLSQEKEISILAQKLKTIMNPELFRHSLGTMEYASNIAEKLLHSLGDRLPKLKGFAPDELYYKILVAALLHDYGKVFSYQQLYDTAVNEHLGLSVFELDCQPLLHSFVGPCLVKKDFGISDNIILKSVGQHAIGCCDMNIVDKLIYIADKLEVSRNYEGIENLRKLSLENINLCLLEVYKSNIIWVIMRNYYLHPNTSKIWNKILGGLKNAI